MAAEEQPARLLLEPAPADLLMGEEEEEEQPPRPLLPARSDLNMAEARLDTAAAGASPPSPRPGRGGRAAGAGAAGNISGNSVVRRADGGYTLDIQVDPDLLLAAAPAGCRVEVRSLVACASGEARARLVPFGTAVRRLVSSLPGQTPMTSGARLYPASRRPQQRGGRGSAEYGTGAAPPQLFFLAVSLSLTDEQLAALSEQQRGLELPLPGWGGGAATPRLSAAAPRRQNLQPAAGLAA